jgi:hypothetical protein
MTTTASNHLTGSAAEFRIKDSLKRIKAKFILPTCDLLGIAQQSTVGKRRVEQATPYLLREYNNDLLNVPQSELLDRIYGIDCLITYRGWTIALDITVNLDSLTDKANKQRMLSLSPLYTQVGIDLAAVVCVSNSFTDADLRKALSEVIAGKSVVHL